MYSTSGTLASRLPVRAMSYVGTMKDQWDLSKVPTGYARPLSLSVCRSSLTVARGVIGRDMQQHSHHGGCVL